MTLGEGGTPLLEAARRLARELGVRRLLLKFEGANPTGTVKDRSSATAIAAALQFGLPRDVGRSAPGNAGSSIAAYSARAGLRSLIFAYERTSAPKLLHMAATTRDLILYKGVYDDLITIWDRLVEDRLFFDCGASRNAYKHEGKKTIAYEIAEQTRLAAARRRGGAGGGRRDVHRGGPRLSRDARGRLDRRRAPMVAAQATRANAVVRAFRDGTAIVPLKIGYTVAEGLAAGRSRHEG